MSVRRYRFSPEHRNGPFLFTDLADVTQRSKVDFKQHGLNPGKGSLRSQEVQATGFLNA